MISRRFRVKVNGKTFEVDVEEIGGSASAPSAAVPGRVPASMPGSRGASQPPAAATPAPAAPAVDGPGWVQCPMAGKVQKILVKVGDAVKADTVVVILEAMKMETSVCAGNAGTIRDIAASEGAVVDSGARLVRVE